MSWSGWSVRIAWKRWPSWSVKRQLRAGVRALAAHDQPRALRASGQIDAVGDLGDLAVARAAAVLVERRDPRLLGDLEDRGADRLGQLVADREARRQRSLRICSDSRPG